MDNWLHVHFNYFNQIMSIYNEQINIFLYVDTVMIYNISQ